MATNMCKNTNQMFSPKMESPNVAYHILHRKSSRDKFLLYLGPFWLYGAPWWPKLVLKIPRGGPFSLVDPHMCHFDLYRNREFFIEPF